MTTNNHPAHGPVSLKRLHQISEILSKAAAQSDGGNLGYAMADAVKVINGAIASFGAEPVGYTDAEELRSDDNDIWMWKSPHGFWKDIPLYTAPPAPVVPPKIEPDYEVIKAILPTANPDFYACCVAADMWNACRAAMLQAGNYPVTPDGWVPVSERMPEVGDIVLTAMGGSVNVGEMERSGANCRYFTSVISGRELPATHWMPLPAAPQQEVKSALEHGMQRYSGAMQKLSEGDK
ncbi:DUF551 domain-containing protein [Citrobacter werkmanii]|nr:DUF551 domain-containing protein [Citrobacter werkmanii]MBJ9597629.1 DUF551 domain-containing protein [Citrobacter werkmanii]